MSRFGLRDSIAAAAAVVGPLLVALVLVPFRGSISDANVALLLVVVVVAVAAAGSRLAGARDCRFEYGSLLGHPPTWSRTAA